MLSRLTRLSWTLHLGILFFQHPLFSPQLTAYQQQIAPQTIDPHREEAVIKWAEARLRHTGTLKAGPDGFVYVKVDDEYINNLFPILENPAYTKPPYFRRSNSPGAHISVFYVDELKKIGKIEELGKTYTFKIKKLAMVPEKTKDYIVLQIESPELEELREKHGVSRLIKGHDFHITIAKKKQKTAPYVRRTSTPAVEVEVDFDDTQEKE